MLLHQQTPSSTGTGGDQGSPALPHATEKGNASGTSAPDCEIIHSFAALPQAAGVESFEESSEVLSDDLTPLMRGAVGHKC